MLEPSPHALSIEQLAAEVADHGSYRRGRWLPSWPLLLSAGNRRALFAAIARTCSDPPTMRAYLDLVGPFEPPDIAAAMREQWGCALVMRGLFRLAGVYHPRLSPPYRIGQAMADVVRVGYAQADMGPRPWTQATRTTTPADVPMGAVVIIGQGSSTHVLCVVDVSPDADRWTTVEGVREGGRPTVRTLSRAVKTSGGQMLTHDKGAGWRTVRGWIDPALLAYEPWHAMMSPYPVPPPAP